MPCNKINTPTGPTFICSSPVYDFGGHLFEVHSYCGPHPLRRIDHMPYSKIPGPAHKFWDAWYNWDKMTDSEKENTRVDSL